MGEAMKCPMCGIDNSDNWPLDIDGKIVEGGCQNCWEDQSDAAWWDMVQNDFRGVLEVKYEKARA